MAPHDPSDVWGCVIGRFHPFHRDHLSLAEAVLESGQRLVVAITNADPSWRVATPEAPHRHTDAANPFNFWQRAELVRAGLHPLGIVDGVRIVPFPIHDPKLWSSYLPHGTECWVRERGPWEARKMRELASRYSVRAIPAAPGEVSGSSIRRRMREGDRSWILDVPSGVAGLIDAWTQNGLLVMSSGVGEDSGST